MNIYPANYDMGVYQAMSQQPNLLRRVANWLLGIIDEPPINSEYKRQSSLRAAVDEIKDDLYMLEIDVNEAAGKLYALGLSDVATARVIDDVIKVRPREKKPL